MPSTQYGPRFGPRLSLADRTFVGCITFHCDWALVRKSEFGRARLSINIIVLNISRLETMFNEREIGHPILPTELRGNLPDYESQW